MMTINYKTKTNLIEKLLENSLFEELQTKSLFGKILKKKQFSDIYFHSGSLDKQSVENIENSKITIVNSQAMKKELFQKIDIDRNKIEVIYPPVEIKDYDLKKTKLEVLNSLELDENSKIIFFTAKNFKNSGIIDFINVINFLNYKNFKAIIAGNKKEINNLKFQISRLEVKERLILLDDYEDIDSLFVACDVFFLPTYNKNFSSNILKAMYCKSAVFTTVINDASELIDVFSTMESPSDRSMQFKLDALLQNEDELDTIKQQNYNIAKDHTLDKQYEKLKKIIGI